MSPVAKYLEIGDELRALCARFGVDYESVLEIKIKPSVVEVVVAKRKNGKFYVENDGIAKATFEYLVTT